MHEHIYIYTERERESRQIPLKPSQHHASSPRVCHLKEPQLRHATNAKYGQAKITDILEQQRANRIKAVKGRHLFKGNEQLQRPLEFDVFSNQASRTLELKSGICTNLCGNLRAQKHCRRVTTLLPRVSLSVSLCTSLSLFLYGSTHMYVYMHIHIIVFSNICTDTHTHTHLLDIYIYIHML